LLPDKTRILPLITVVQEYSSPYIG